MSALLLKGWRKDLRPHLKTTIKSRSVLSSEDCIVKCSVSVRWLVQYKASEFCLTDHTVELSDPHAAWRFIPWRSAENHDHLHYRCSRSRCCCQFNKSESKYTLFRSADFPACFTVCVL